MTDFLDGMLNDPKAAPQAAPEPAKPAETPATPPAPSPAPPKEPAPAPELPKAADAPKGEPPKDQGPFFSAMLDEREKRQRLEKELEAFRRDQQQRSSPRPQYQDDPDAWARHIEQRQSEAVRDIRFEVSEEFANEKHGDDKVKAAKTWSEERARSEAQAYGFSPFAAEFMRQRHPIDWLVKQHKQAQWLAQVGDDPEAYVRRKYAELTAVPAAVTAAPLNGGAPPQPGMPLSKPFVPDKSLVDAPSAGGIRTGTPVGPGATFDAVFPK
jgi:hypothetical protein